MLKQCAELWEDLIASGAPIFVLVVPLIGVEVIVIGSECPCVNVGFRKPWMTGHRFEINEDSGRAFEFSVAAVAPDLSRHVGLCVLQRRNRERPRFATHHQTFVCSLKARCISDIDYALQTKLTEHTEYTT